MKEAMQKWLKRHQITFDIDTANSICNDLELGGEKADECIGLCYQLETEKITQDEFTGGLCVLTGKEPEEVIEILMGKKPEAVHEVTPVTPEVTEFIAAFDRSYAKQFAAIPEAPPDHAIGLRGVANELGMGFNSLEFKSIIQKMIDMGVESPYVFAPDRIAGNNLQLKIPGILHEQSIGLATRRLTTIPKPPVVEVKDAPSKD